MPKRAQSVWAQGPKEITDSSEGETHKIMVNGFPQKIFQQRTKANGEWQCECEGKGARQSNENVIQAIIKMLPNKG